ncbi:MAG: CCA tRNA nucleotidyltransferase [Chlamydiota bacterium]|nr:CCA tRNA nucleotidyltransferase [Chlamydiota bacterium]
MTDQKKIYAERIVDRLRKHNFEAYFAGGCVRDMLMGKTPHDYDIATNAHPDSVISLFKKTIPVGVQFGVVLVLMPEDDAHVNEEIDQQKKYDTFEVATFRSEGPYIDGRHPSSVSFTSAREDVLRRDFTVNGLLYDPHKKEIMDYVEGREDIERKLIRAIGDARERFDEDKLRILRAVRFAVNLDFQIEEETFRAICECSSNITQVSAERIRDELVKIFTGFRPGRGLELLSETGLLKLLLPEIEIMKGVEQPPEFHPEGDVYIHTRMMLDSLKYASLNLAFGVLLHDIGKPPTYSVSDRIRFNNHDKVGARMTQDILKRFKFSNKDIDNIVACVDNHIRFKDVKKMREAKLKRFMARRTFEDELELHRIDCLCSHGMMDNWEFLCEKYEQFKQEPPQVHAFITGDHLIEMGYLPGPLFKQILTEVEDKVLEHEIHNLEEAKAWVLSNYQKQ